MYWNQLTKEDTIFYKGVAILLIVGHNFFHLFPSPRENEFGFSSKVFSDFLYIILHSSENTIRAFFSIFGHFGVQIFLFISAYGLTKKYIYRKPQYWLFIWQRIAKIYPSFILSIFAWMTTVIISSFFQNGISLVPFCTIISNIKSLFLKITLLSNFFPGYALSPVGPWWFISLIFQFYFIFPILYFLYTWKGEIILLVVPIFSFFVVVLTHHHIANINIYFTAFGHFPEFCLGIYLACNDKNTVNISKNILFLSFILFYLGNINLYFWYINHITALIILLYTVDFANKKICKNNYIKKIFYFFGNISMYLFLVHGFLRSPFIDLARKNDNWIVTISLYLGSLCCSIFVAIIILKVEKYIRSKFKNKNFNKSFHWTRFTRQ